MAEESKESYEVTWPTKPPKEFTLSKDILNFQEVALMLKTALTNDPSVNEELILLGIEGEERVYNLIEKVLGNSIAFHSIPLLRIKKDIDHLIVIGNDVFLLNTKNYQLESMLVDGEYIVYGRKRLTDLIDLQRDAREIEKLTGIKVKPLLVLSTNVKLTVKNTPIVPIVNLDTLKQIIESGANLTPCSNYVELLNNRKTWGISSIKQYSYKQKGRKSSNYKRKIISKKTKNRLLRKALFWVISLLFMIPSLNSLISLSNSLNSNSNLADIYSQKPVENVTKLDQCYSKAVDISTLNLCNLFHGVSTELDLPIKRTNCERLGGELIEKGVVHKWECNQTPEECIKNSQSISNLNLCNVIANPPEDNSTRMDMIVQEKVFKCETLGGALVYNDCKIL